MRVCVARAIDPDSMRISQTRCIRCSHCSAVCPTAAVHWPTADGEATCGEALQSLTADTALELETVIKRRRSMRHYTGEVLSQSMIDRIVAVTNHAPTGTNSRRVTITVVNDPRTMQEISDIAMRYFRRLATLILNPLTVPFILLFAGRRRLRRLRGYRRQIDRYFGGHNILTHGAPALFVFSADRRSSCPSEDALIWATTANLYAESLGLGTCYNGFLVRAARMHRPLRRRLGLPEGHTVFETFTAGYPAVAYQRAAYRDPCVLRVI